MAGRTYQIDCQLCGEPVTTTGDRYLRHVRSGTKPLCRKNGCYKFARHGAAASDEVVKGVKGLVFRQKRFPKACPNGAFAQGKLKRVVPTVCETRGRSG